MHITWLVALSAIKETLMRKGEWDGGGERGGVMGSGEGEGVRWGRGEGEDKCFTSW